MDNNLFDLNRQLNALSVFRSILETDVVSSLQKLLYAIEKSSLDEQLTFYGAFSRALYEQGGDLTEFVKTFIIEDKNFFLIKRLNNAIISQSIYECLDEELTVLQKLANTTTPQIKDLINYDEYLPRWDTQEIDLKKEYSAMLDALPSKGFGIFAKYKAFKVNDGTLLPVKNADQQTSSTVTPESVIKCLKTPGLWQKENRPATSSSMEMPVLVSPPPSKPVQTLSMTRGYGLWNLISPSFPIFPSS